MITTARLVEADNLFLPNEIMQLSYPREAHGGVHCKLAAISCVDQRIGCHETWVEVCARASSLALEVLDRSDDTRFRPLMLFVSDDVWRIDSRITRHKGLWRGGARFAAIRDSVVCTGPEVVLEENGMLRFSAVATVERGDFARCVDFIRESRSSFILVNRTGFDLSAATTTFFSDQTFGRSSDAGGDTSIDWARIACAVCPKGDLVIRASGSHDDPDSAVDLIYDPRVTKVNAGG